MHVSTGFLKIKLICVLEEYKSVFLRNPISQSKNRFIVI